MCFVCKLSVVNVKISLLLSEQIETNGNEHDVFIDVVCQKEISLSINFFPVLNENSLKILYHGGKSISTAYSVIKVIVKKNSSFFSFLAHANNNNNKYANDLRTPICSNVNSAILSLGNNTRCYDNHFNKI